MLTSISYRNRRKWRVTWLNLARFYHGRSILFIIFLITQYGVIFFFSQALSCMGTPKEPCACDVKSTFFDVTILDLNLQMNK